jgi:UDP-glucose 4-epimerase
LESVEAVIGDISDRQAVGRVVAGAKTVFHLAAKLHVPNPTEQMRAEYERVNVEGTRAIVEAAQAAGVQRVVLFSTISVYGPTGSEPVDEDSAPNPDTIYAKTKLQAEEIALAARNAAGQPLATVLRLSAVYGPRMKGNYVTLANAMAKGRFVPVGDGNNLRTLVYVHDVVRAAILAAEHPLAAGRIYNVSDGTVHSLNEILAAMAAALGRRPPRFHVPVELARVAAATADRLLTIQGRPPRLASAVDKFVESAAVRAHRIQEELGFRPVYDLERGWWETIVSLGLR